MTRRNVPSYSPGARRLQLRIAGLLEVQRLRIAEVVRRSPPPGPPKKSARVPVAAAVAFGVFVGMMGCNAHVPPVAPAVEAVGTLAAGPSVYSAPVHATTDLTPQFGAVDTGDDSVGDTVTTVTTAPADAGSDSELPDVAPKTDGVTMGGAR